MRIVFFGSGEFGVPSLKNLADSEHQLLAVVTQPARPAGRGKKIIATPIAQAAQRLGLPIEETANANDPEFVAAIRELGPDVLVVIAFGQKMGDDLLNLPDCRSINLHGSLLPAYRGAAPINWAIINGEKKTGLTIIELDNVWDGGAILGQAATEIRTGETAGELHDRLAALGPDLLCKVLRQIADGTVKPLAQDKTLVSKAPKLTKGDGGIDWSRPARKLCNHIHGMWPWPGAYCLLELRGKAELERLTIARVQVVTAEDDVDGPAALRQKEGAGVLPGTVGEDLTIKCGEDRLRLLEVKPAGGKLMAFKDFANGRRLESGDRFLNG